ncbi:uncharacterized protein LOC114798984 [Denticeps clupeoides]|uniref:uncharacterized protein LOC114798984 n=1 Tax=Denticeps clupeoides TaxID=299321 RepID=UPI0010A314ED|nr:uncharacterized protein LOC114798984 [Denticeps clupeoides]
MRSNKQMPKTGKDRSKILSDGVTSVSSSLGASSPQRLQAENAELKAQLEQLREQYQQLLQEGGEEKFEERRVNLLKAQVMQLERQVVLLSEGLSSHVCRSQEVENVLDSLVERLRALPCSDSSGSEVSIARSELAQLTERCAEVKRKLSGTNKAATVEDLSMPWVLTTSDLVKQPVTLLDLCYGKTNNLNLQQASALESRLSQLFKHLHGIMQTLRLILAPGDDHPSKAPLAVFARLLNQAASCSPVLDRCCLDLLTLSLIGPLAPTGGSDQRVSLELRPENVLSLMPAFARGPPQQRARRAAEALCRAATYSQLMYTQQVEALQAELEFHRHLYRLQVTYTQELIQGVRQAYHTFQDGVTESLCTPLQDVLSCYADLKSTSSEAALRDFLTAFKSNSTHIQQAVEALRPSKGRGDEALSRYGKDFLRSVEALLTDCGERRERAAGELQVLRREFRQAAELLDAPQRPAPLRPSDQAGPEEAADAGGSSSKDRQGPVRTVRSRPGRSGERKEPPRTGGTSLSARPEWQS